MASWLPLSLSSYAMSPTACSLQQSLAEAPPALPLPACGGLLPVTRAAAVVWRPAGRRQRGPAASALARLGVAPGGAGRKVRLKFLYSPLLSVKTARVEPCYLLPCVQALFH